MYVFDKFNYFFSTKWYLPVAGIECTCILLTKLLLQLYLLICCVAFAELQTDMSEIAGEISGTGGIPFRSYSSFCMSVLFPGASPDYHPVIRGIEVCEIY